MRTLDATRAMRGVVTLVFLNVIGLQTGVALAEPTTSDEAPASPPPASSEVETAKPTESKDDVSLAAATVPPPSIPIDYPFAVVPTPTPSRGEGSRWYGWQTLAADAASAGLLTIGLTTWTVESTVGGYGGFLLATPVIHAVHGNGGRAFGSFALRLLVPTLAGGIGAGAAFLASKGEPEVVDLVKDAGVGMAIGATVCVAIDGAVFAWQQRETGGVGASIDRPLRPTIGIRIGRMIGVAGTF